MLHRFYLRSYSPLLFGLGNDLVVPYSNTINLDLAKEEVLKSENIFFYQVFRGAETLGPLML